MRQKIGCYASYVIGASLLMSIVTSKVYVLYLVGRGVWWYYASASLFLMWLSIYAWLRMRAHNRSLCEDCFSRMPLDASKYAKRRKYILLSIHIHISVIIAYVVALALLAVYTAATNSDNYYQWMIASTPLLYLLYAYDVHRRFQPWCEKCANGGEEVKEKEPTPDLVST